MKKIAIALLLIVALASTAIASDKNVVLVTKHITRSQTSQLPDKTDVMKLKNLQLNGTGEYGPLAQATLTLLEQIASTNYESNTFWFTLEWQPSGDIALQVVSSDVMESSPQERKTFLGNIKVGNCYFVIQEKSNKQLMKKIVEGCQGKTQFEHVFEYVVDPISYGGTRLNAMWSSSSNSFTINQFCINGENQLMPSSQETSSTQNKENEAK